MSIKTPEYTLIEAHDHFTSGYDKRTLEAGSFINPIEPQYLPQHIKNTDEFKKMDHDLFVYCYTAYGILPIPRRIIRSRI